MSATAAEPATATVVPGAYQDCSVHAVWVKLDDGRIVNALLTLNGKFVRPIALDVCVDELVVVHAWHPAICDGMTGVARNVRVMKAPSGVTFLMYDRVVTLDTKETATGANVLDVDVIRTWPTVADCTFSVEPDMIAFVRSDGVPYSFTKSMQAIRFADCNLVYATPQTGVEVAFKEIAPVKFAWSRTGTDSAGNAVDLTSKKLPLITFKLSAV
jgi:hypothetical protein